MKSIFRHFWALSSHVLGSGIVWGDTRGMVWRGRYFNNKIYISCKRYDLFPKPWLSLIKQELVFMFSLISPPLDFCTVACHDIEPKADKVCGDFIHNKLKNHCDSGSFSLWQCPWAFTQGCPQPKLSPDLLLNPHMGDFLGQYWLTAAKTVPRTEKLLTTECQTLLCVIH